MKKSIYSTLLLIGLQSIVFGQAVVYVPGNAGWVNTGVEITNEVLLTISASGFCAGVIGMIPSDPPDGVGFGAASSSYLAPGLERYSLVGKIGTNMPFQVGSFYSEIVDQTGVLFLAYNDEEYSDNSGGYTANILVQDSSLPVELYSFSATIDDEYDSIVLRWTTQSEVDNLGFNIWRSVNTKDRYTKLNPQIIPGQGSSSQRHHYCYKDMRVVSGNTYRYYIENLSFTGEKGCSQIITVDFDINKLAFDNILEQNSPNPFNAATRIEYQIQEDSFVNFSIYNSRGQIVQTPVNEFQPKGSYWVYIHTENLPSGIYFYRLRTDSFFNQKSMILLK